jgi:hypothetical protein
MVSMGSRSRERQVFFTVLQKVLCNEASSGVLLMGTDEDFVRPLAESGELILLLGSFERCVLLLRRCLCCAAAAAQVPGCGEERVACSF